MLGTVVRLLRARERMAVAGPGGAVRTVTVPLLQQGPYRDTPTGLATAHRLGPQPTDRRQGKQGQLSHGSGRCPKRYLIILTVVADGAVEQRFGVGQDA